MFWGLIVSDRFYGIVELLFSRYGASFAQVQVDDCVWAGENVCYVCEELTILTGNVALTASAITRPLKLAWQ